jgi:hypothetical protein
MATDFDTLKFDLKEGGIQKRSGRRVNPVPPKIQALVDNAYAQGKRAETVLPKELVAKFTRHVKNAAAKHGDMKVSTQTDEPDDNGNVAFRFTVTKRTS